MKLHNPEQIQAPVSDASNRIVLDYVRHAAGTLSNVATRMQLLDTGEHLLPLSINDGEPRSREACGTLPNSYVVSPLTAYNDYAQYEVAQLGSPWLTTPLRHVIGLLGQGLARARIDRIVHVNNWLLSTNLYPPNWQGDDLPQITRQLVESFPDHVIGFRSLNRHSNRRLIERLLALGYLAIPSRQVYLFDARAGKESAFLQRRDTRNDARLLARTDYAQIPGDALKEDDFARIAHLYKQLYLEKYSPLNPQFDTAWLRAGQRDGWLQLTALRSAQGRIDAVLGWISNSDILTTPVVGYDTALPQKLGLYRLISQISLEEAARRRCLFNMSAGAAHFKRMRGGVPEMEYNLVYVGHLDPARQRTWRILGRLLQRIAVPIMQKFKL